MSYGFGPHRHENYQGHQLSARRLRHPARAGVAHLQDGHRARGQGIKGLWMRLDTSTSGGPLVSDF